MRMLLTAMLMLMAMFTVGAQSLREADAPLVLPREYVIGSCTLNGAAHELDEGYFHCGTTQIFMDERNIMAFHLREEVGHRGQLIWRRAVSK